MLSNSSVRSVFASQKSYWLVAMVIALALFAWTFSLVFGSRVEGISLATATPTKTPGVYSLRTEGVAFALPSRGVLPTSTPIPTSVAPAAVTPTPVQPPAPADENAPEPWVVKLAQTRGLNPNGRYIVVDQAHQQMHIINDGDLVRVLNVTTGDPEQGWHTPTWFGVIGEYWGSFAGVGGVMADEGWWLFERGGNFLIHGLPYTLDALGRKQYKGWDDLGAAPASHGCIRLSPEDARWFTNWRPEGAPIIILPYPET
jgi:lipoprotein-anchoring transpeptidase ErfK/SrfK